MRSNPRVGNEGNPPWCVRCLLCMNETRHAVGNSRENPTTQVILMLYILIFVYVFHILKIEGFTLITLIPSGGRDPSQPPQEIPETDGLPNNQPTRDVRTGGMKQRTTPAGTQ